MAKCGNALGCRMVPAAAILPGVRPAQAHLEPGQVERLSFERLKVSEMQDETQEDAATSSPDPLTLVVPEGRDIDVSQSPPSSAADSSGA
jgi:hypothetical protein